jgi:hypothetical protein
LQERGAYKRDYLPGTLREKLFGRSRLLPPGHPAAAHRQARHHQVRFRQSAAPARPQINA